MLNNEEFEQLQKTANASANDVRNQTALFHATFDGVLKMAPKEHIGILEKVRAQTNHAIELAKQGKQTEALEILNKLQNERPNN